MSYGAPGAPDFDFWEFVCCSRCRMPFGLENGSATVPFWLTECGHIICNNHLSPDRSCCQCGAQDIQLAPLHREMDAPMSEWFQSIPLSLESVAHAAKFQQEAMAAQIRYHKLRHQQLRQLVERLRQEIEELKSRAREPQIEHHQEQLDDTRRIHSGEVSHHLNANGKREMAYTHQFDARHRRPRTDSSPRSITTPVAPDRLTLLPGQQLPGLSVYKQQEQPRRSQHSAQSLERPDYDHQHGVLGDRSASSRTFGSHGPRPASSRPLEQYAFVPQDNNKFCAPAPSHIQTAPRIFQRADGRQNDQQIQQSGSSNNESSNPSSSRFKPARFVPPLQTANASRAPAAREVMGPPPTPQHVHQSNKAPVNNVATLISGGTASRRFFPEPSDKQIPLGTREISRASGALASGNTPGQRTPFVSNLGQRSGFS